MVDRMTYRYNYITQYIEHIKTSLTKGMSNSEYVYLQTIINKKQ